MADSERDVQINIKLKQDAAKFTPPDLSAATKQVSDYKKSIEDAGNRAKEAALKVTDANLRAGDSFKLAGEGAFTMARGIVAIGVADEDMQVIIQSLAKVQGAFDLFKGGFDLFKGISQGITAMKQASEAAAVAQTAMAAANALEATTAETAAAANTTLMISMGPIGWIIAGISAAVGIAVLAWKNWGDTINEMDFSDINTKMSEVQDMLNKLNDATSSAARKATNKRLRVADTDAQKEEILRQRTVEINRGNIQTGETSIDQKRAKLNTLTSQSDDLRRQINTSTNLDEIAALEEKKKALDQNIVDVAKSISDATEELFDINLQRVEIMKKTKAAEEQRLKQIEEDSDDSIFGTGESPAAQASQELIAQKDKEIAAFEALAQTLIEKSAAAELKYNELKVELNR